MNSKVFSTIAGLALAATTLPALSENTPRGMFLEQMHKPDSQVNTGISYWLELKRNGVKSHVSNKTSFQNGDRLRFHIKPNFDGFGYILLMQGSNGDKQLLFPSTELTENTVKAGNEITLPAGNHGEDAWLKFDENPGTEVLRVIVSRKTVDAKEQLHSGTAVVICSGNDDKSDEIPDGTLVSISIPPNAKPPNQARNLTVETEDVKPNEQGMVTVISNDPSKQLSVDIALDHKKGG